jgi:hypothetical protein
MNYGDLIDESKYNYGELRFSYLRFYVPLDTDIDKPNKYGDDGWLIYANTWLATYFDQRFYKEVRISEEYKRYINVFKTYMLHYIENDYFVPSEMGSSSEELRKIEERKNKLITAVNELSNDQYDHWLGGWLRSYNVNGGSKRRRRSNKSKKSNKKTKRRKTRRQSSK